MHCSTSSASTPQVVYPNLAGFGNQNFLKVEDDELRKLCATVYNDAMAEIQAETGDRVLPMALMPWWNIDDCVRRGRALRRARSARHRDVQRPGQHRHARPGRRRVDAVLGGMRRARHTGQLPHRGEPDVDEHVRTRVVAVHGSAAPAGARLDEPVHGRTHACSATCCTAEFSSAFPA